MESLSISRTASSMRSTCIAFALPCTRSPRIKIKNTASFGTQKRCQKRLVQCRSEAVLRARTTPLSYKTLKDQYYRLLKDQGFKDIEYGLDDPQRIYQPVNLREINREATEYYDLVWEIYHEWSSQGRRERDLTLAELLASQQGETGTLRGISRVLKEKGLKPAAKQSVQITINEINSLIKQKIKIIPNTSK